MIKLFLFHNCGVACIHCLNLITSTDFLSESECVACGDIDELMAVGTILGGILVKPFAL